MSTLDEFFELIDEKLKGPKFKDCNTPVFRGHTNKSFTLLPTLMRVFENTGKSLEHLENNLYSDFNSLVGPRVKFNSSWEALYAMRHEGIPTRLLDWTENIGTALYFALDSPTIDGPHIWILNPYELNVLDINSDDCLINPEETMKPYHETFVKLVVESEIPINRLPISIYPRRTNERIFAQRGLFTLHGSDIRKMEDTCSSCLEKIEIPSNLVDKLRRIIKQFGINKYSVYPDFKGLADYLKDYYKY